LHTGRVIFQGGGKQKFGKANLNVVKMSFDDFAQFNFSNQEIFLVRVFFNDFTDSFYNQFPKLVALL
jgi:uncharacterized membrane protein YpjA